MKLLGQESFKKGVSGELDSSKWAWEPAHIDWIKNPKQFQLTKSFEIFGKQKSKVLILARPAVQAGSLIQLFKQRKKGFIYLNIDEFIDGGKVHFDLEKNKYLLIVKSKKIDLSAIQSIYYEPADILDVGQNISKNSDYDLTEKLYISRWCETLISLEKLIKNIKWFPATPSKLLENSQLKGAELSLAKSLGFNIPKTIVSNSPNEIKAFISKNKTTILREHGLRSLYDKKTIKSFHTRKVVASEIKQNLLSAPCVFQKYIEKKYEVRAIVIDGKVLACKIDSQVDVKSRQDWRGFEHLVPFTPMLLPKSLEQKLVKFQKCLGFNLSSFDLIKSTTGKFYFLEMNRPGQWFFIEALSGLSVRQELVKKL